MERWATSPTFPLSLAALGSLIVLVLTWLGAPVDSAVALGLGAYAAGLALRNWWVTEDERPLLAEELQGMHDTLDALRADADELRHMATDLAGILEDTVEQDQAARGLEIDEMHSVFTARLAELEGRIAALAAADAPEPTAAAPQADAAAAETAAAAEAFRADVEARIGKLAKALTLAVEQMRRQETRIVAAETAAQRSADRAAAPADNSATAPTGARADALVKRPVETASAAPAADLARPTETGSASAAPAPASAPVAAPATPRRTTPTLRADTVSRLEALRAARPAPETASAKEPEPAPAEETGSDRAVHAAAARPDPQAAQANPAATHAALTHAAPPHRPSSVAVTPVMTMDRSAARHLRVTSDDASVQDALDLAQGVRGSGRDLTVFYPVSADAARDGRLLRGPLARARLAEGEPGAAPHASPLALEVAQEDFAAFTRDEAAVRRLTASGAALAVTNIADWNMDISEMARFGVRYVILDGDELLDRAEDAAAAGRLLATFERFGLELIVADVADDAMRERLAAYGAPSGYGPALADEHRVEVPKPANGDGRPALNGGAPAGDGRPAELTPERADGAFAPSASGPAIRPEIAAFASRVAGRSRQTAATPRR